MSRLIGALRGLLATRVAAGGTLRKAQLLYMRGIVSGGWLCCILMPPPRLASRLVLPWCCKEIKTPLPQDEMDMRETMTETLGKVLL